MTDRVAVGVAVPPVRVDVLGPLRLIVGEELVEVPGPKRRALLALLAKSEGRAVAVDDLVDALWPAGMPGSARASLHSHISRLRSHLGPAASRLEGLSGAYRLRLDGEGSGTDVVQARSLLAAAKSVDPVDGCNMVKEARSLWRGPPLAEFVDVAALAAWAVTLNELRRAVEEAHTVAALDAGAAGEAVELARTLVAEDSRSETAVLLLMRALDATGRAADALRAGHDYRRRLADQTGLDPSAALGELERAIAGRTSTRPAALPRPSSRLRGRDSELAGLHRLLADERLVTVIGTGGVGKTRLAAEVAARAERATALWLAPVTDAAGIPHALASALDLHVVHGDVLDACAALVAAGPQLLLIDNCEHLLASARDIVTALLESCPQLTVLATSREPLGVAAEQRFRLAPLPLTTLDDLDDIASSPAVAVFIDRANRVRPEFAPGADDLRLIAAIVRRLDGIPLAIELAASRLSSLELADLDDRLDRSLDLFGEGHAGTLRHTIEWSYALLPNHEQRLFRHLCIFPDGFDLATAEAVAADLDLQADPAHALAHLVDASMVEAALGGEPRYRLLDIVRSYARDQLEFHGEADVATERFLRWALQLASWIDHTTDTDQEPQADRVLRRELANLRAAWRLTRTDHRLDNAARMITGLTDTAGWRDLTEVWEWALELAADPATETHPQAASLFGLGATSAWSRGELARADRLARRGLALGGEGMWQCQAALALTALSTGNLTDAVTLATEAAAHATRTDQSLGIAALAAAYRGDLDEATTLNRHLAAISASPTIQGFHCYIAAEIDALAGNTHGAEEQYQRAVALARESGATFLAGIASVGLLTLLANTNRIADALERYSDLIDYWERTGGWVQQWTTLRNLARLLSSLGDTQTASFLFTAADHAPDAPTTIDSHDDSERHHVCDDTTADILADAASTSRLHVLQIARQAIARHCPNTPART